MRFFSSEIVAYQVPAQKLVTIANLKNKKRELVRERMYVYNCKLFSVVQSAGMLPNRLLYDKSLQEGGSRENWST